MIKNLLLFGFVFAGLVVAQPTAPVFTLSSTDAASLAQHSERTASLDTDAGQQGEHGRIRSECAAQHGQWVGSEERTVVPRGNDRDDAVLLLTTCRWLCRWLCQMRVWTSP